MADALVSVAAVVVAVLAAWDARRSVLRARELAGRLVEHVEALDSDAETTGHQPRGWPLA